MGNVFIYYSLQGNTPFGQTAIERRGRTESTSLWAKLSHKAHPNWMPTTFREFGAFGNAKWAKLIGTFN
jgi:hypothetical protein